MTMKKFLLFCLLLVFVSGFVYAQDDLPNKGFEEWDADTTLTGYVYYDPLSWNTPNVYTSLLASQVVVLRDEDAMEGNYSLKMETKVLSIQPLGEIPIPGVITLGEIEIDLLHQTGGIIGGIPFTEKPYAFKAYVKASLAENDSAFIAAYTYKYNSVTAQKDTLAQILMYFSEEISDWVEIEIPFEYLSDTTPDSINIICFSSSSFKSSYEGSVLKIDSMSIKMESGIEYQVLGENNILTYPNPADDFITFDFGNTLEKAVLNIFNSKAEMIQTTNILDSKESINLSHFAKGSYFYQLIQNNRKCASGHFIKK